MARPDIVGKSAEFENIFTMLIETRAAARTLYELFPDNSTVEPLYRYLDDTLKAIWDELLNVDRTVVAIPRLAGGFGTETS